MSFSPALRPYAPFLRHQPEYGYNSQAWLPLRGHCVEWGRDRAQVICLRIFSSFSGQLVDSFGEFVFAPAATPLFAGLAAGTHTITVRQTKCLIIINISLLQQHLTLVQIKLANGLLAMALVTGLVNWLGRVDRRCQ